jgi:hypothetical protein
MIEGQGTEARTGEAAVGLRRYPRLHAVEGRHQHHPRQIALQRLWQPQLPRLHACVRRRRPAASRESPGVVSQIT